MLIHHTASLPYSATADILRPETQTFLKCWLVDEDILQMTCLLLVEKQKKHLISYQKNHTSGSSMYVSEPSKLQ